jgi:hypothetical protein
MKHWACQEDATDLFVTIPRLVSLVFVTIASLMNQSDPTG